MLMTTANLSIPSSSISVAWAVVCSQREGRDGCWNRAKSAHWKPWLSNSLISMSGDSEWIIVARIYLPRWWLLFSFLGEALFIALSMITLIVSACPCSAGEPGCSRSHSAEDICRQTWHCLSFFILLTLLFLPPNGNTAVPPIRFAHKEQQKNQDWAWRMVHGETSVGNLKWTGQM